MAVIEGWFPPSRENYQLILFIWQLYPLFASAQWLTKWYGMGKTSTPSVLNVPGRVGWLTMECPGFLTLLYMMRTLPAQSGVADLPWQNRVLAGLFVIHYAYRAILFPLMQPSMAPMHVLVWSSALVFQVSNGLCIGAWLAAYGPTTAAAWDAQLSPLGVLQFVLGIGLFYAGLAANFYHDDELREIRRREEERQRKVAKEEGTTALEGIEKHYAVPQAGLFKYMLYPHYFVEWIEWTGFWIACGWACPPARAFVVNEVTSMLPRAVKGRRWYIEKFGEEKIKGRWAVIPWVW